MTMTPDEAANALRDIEQTGRRSGQAFGYRHSGPHFVLWGLVWMAGYSASDLVPKWSGEIWIGLMMIGALGAVLVSRATAERGRATDSGLKVIGLIVIVAAFITATYAIMWPVGPRQQAAFVPLLAAAAYTAIGLWTGMRWVIAGAAITALTLGGFFYVHAHFNLWMAAVGGGGLVLAGLWMRSA